MSGWEDYEPYDAEAARGVLSEILFDQGFMAAAIDCADEAAIGTVSVLDALQAFQGNCWDDQHDGGAHRADLIEVNRLYGYLGREDLRDRVYDVLALISDDAPDEERWAQRP